MAAMVSADHYQHAGKLMQISGFEKQIAEMLLSRPALPIFDYPKIFFEQDQLFADSDHLNDQRVQILSERIASDLAWLKTKASRL